MRALKALGAAAAAGGLILAGTVAPASAAGTGCPTGNEWFLAPVGAAFADIDNGNFADQNGDGLGCFKVNKGQSEKNGVSSWTWKDNTNPS